MAEQSGVALEIALRALRAVADMADAAAQTAAEHGVPAYMIAAAFHRFDEMVDATWPADALSAEMRRLSGKHLKWWEGCASADDHSDESSPE